MSTWAKRVEADFGWKSIISNSPLRIQRWPIREPYADRAKGSLLVGRLCRRTFCPHSIKGTSVNLHIPTYLNVLKAAGIWRKTSTPDALRSAENILREGLEEHHYALPLADELALVLEKQDRDNEAFQLLQELGERLKDAGEETLARFGKIYKKLADKQIETGHYAAAVPRLEESERQYALAFEKFTGFYPRINELTVRFVRAGVAKALNQPGIADRLVQSVRDDALKMLADPALWTPRNDDDNIWIPATQGEANVLLARWPAAEKAYSEAIRQAAGKRFYHDCMRDQIKHLLLPAFQRLGMPFEGKLRDPDAFFALPMETPK